MTHHSIYPQSDFKQIFPHNALALLALSGLGLTMPLLDLFGSNPQFFIAKGHNGTEIVLFGFVIALLIPLAALVLEFIAYLIDGRLGSIVHAVLTTTLGIALTLAVLRKLPLDSDVLILMIATLVGHLILIAERRLQAFRKVLEFLAIAPLAALAIFLFISTSSRLIWAKEASAVSIPGIGHPAPIVILAFDEFPIASLLREDGSINAERFPNFARLAGQSYWFRNGSSVAPFTGGSIASALTGEMPAHGRAPNSIDYPKNLFTLLGDSYQMRAHEEVTQLCPRQLCDQLTESPDEVAWSAEGDAWQRVGSSLLDATVVYAHATLPPSWRAGLPSVSQSLGGFLGQDVVPTEPRMGDKVMAMVDEPPPEPQHGPGEERGPESRTARIQAYRVEELITSIRPTYEPVLYFTHVVLPHFPWELTPSGFYYQPEPRLYDDLGAIPGLVKNGDHWGDDPFLVRQGLQRHLLQVGYVDHLIGRLIDRMQKADIWDDAVVVVFADHGVSFIPNHPRRGPTPDNQAEIYRVPFFIKVPGQIEGVVRDDNAMLIDLMPTLVDVLKIQTEWTFSGRSLFSDTPPPLKKRVIEGPWEAIPASLDSLLAVAERNAATFHHREDWFGIAAVGEYGQLVGLPANDLGDAWQSNFDWVIDQAPAFKDVDFASGFVPILVTGKVVLPPGIPPGEILIAMNGVVAGVGGGFDCEGNKCHFSAMLAEDPLQEGTNTLKVFMRR